MTKKREVKNGTLHCKYGNHWVDVACFRVRAPDRYDAYCRRCKSLYTRKKAEAKCAAEGRPPPEVAPPRAKYGTLPRSHTAPRWTGHNVMLLKKNYVTATKEELIAMFPTKSWVNISAQARRMGLRRPNRWAAYAADYIAINHSTMVVLPTKEILE